MRFAPHAALALALAAAPVAAADVPSPGEIVAAAPAAEWVAIAAEDLLVMTLTPDAKGRTRRLVIQLMPAPFSQGWVGNIRVLAKAHWWDGTAVTRVQDNYVAQWGDPTEKKAVPAGLRTMAESAYETALGSDFHQSISEARNRKDPYADVTTFIAGFPLAVADPPGGPTMATVVKAWPVHCYGMVGVGRNLSPDTGSGAELYAVIGHAPRHLDRNIALVGRVVEGIEHLSSLPRGTGALGVYETAEERTPIVSVRLASELAPAERPRFEYLSTEGATFARYAEARANRRDAFFITPAGGADVCNVPVPVRRVAAR
jgi:cyclophilin family peptidyl-prolyl cis-trans isomerase